MRLTDILSLQGTLFAMILIGAFLTKRGMIDVNARRFLNDLCINVVIPCNIFRSCLIELEPGILKTCGLLFIASLLMQAVCLLLNRFLYNRYPPQQKKVLQYCTIVGMSGFLGNPIAEGLYDAVGVLYTAVYLVPMRVIMWSAGTMYFLKDSSPDKKKVLKNMLTHPCLVATYLGILFLVLQIRLPSVITQTTRYIGNCNSALTMFIVGTVLTEVKVTEIINKDTVLYSILRLGILPAIALAIGMILGLDHISRGICVIMTGMPAGATAAMFAARYDSDAPFATKCVVASTLISMVTLPMWSYFVG